MNQLQICLANNMKRFRKIKKYSQEKLAEKAGASANYIALIECGKRSKKKATFLKIRENRLLVKVYIST